MNSVRFIKQLKTTGLAHSGYDRLDGNVTRAFHKILKCETCVSDTSLATSDTSTSALATTIMPLTSVIELKAPLTRISKFNCTDLTPPPLGDISSVRGRRYFSKTESMLHHLLRQPMNSACLQLFSPMPRGTSSSSWRTLLGYLPPRGHYQR